MCRFFLYDLIYIFVQFDLPIIDVKQKSAKQYKNSLGIFAKLALITWRAYGEQNF